MSHQRSALFGIMGVKLGFIKRQSLEQLDLESLEAAPPALGSLLVDKGLLSQADHDTLSSLVDEAIRSRQGDTASLIETFASGDSNLTIQTAATLPADVEKTVQTESEPPASEQTIPTGTGSDAHTENTIQTAQSIQTAETINTGNDATVLAQGDDDPMATRPDPRAGQQSGGDEDIPAVQEHPGRYEELREFARGGMGKIMLVQDTHLGREIALKQLLPDRVKMATRGGSLPTASLLTVPIIARFLLEAQITGQLEHPSIVPVHEMGFRADGSLYYTMKFVRGRSMQDALKDCNNLQERLKLLTHFLDLCQAMAYAHSRGVIHRDLKPLNVMIGEFGETVVIDWGIAKLKGGQDIHAKEMNEQVRSLRLGKAEDTAKTMEGQTIGSPFYMPPEQSEGKLDEVDERSDIYALGAVLYTILTGQPPYKGLNVREFLEKVVAFDPRPIAELEAEAPPELIAIANRAMARNAKDRYQTSKELADEIEQFIAGGLVGAYQYSFKDLARRFVKKHRKMLATIAVALVALIAVSIVSYVNIVAERNRAVAAEEVAVEQRGIAEEQRAIAEVERREAEEKLYYANISLTQRSIDERLAEQALALLEESPAEYRGWEWGHLYEDIHSELETIEAGGRFAFYFDGGQHFVTGSPNGTVGVYDAATGERMHTLIERAGFQYVMHAGAAGPHVVVSADNAIHVWNGVSGEEVFQFAEPNPNQLTRQTSLSADGSRLAALCSDRQVRVWDVASGDELFSQAVRQPAGAVALLSPDGARLFLAMKDMSVEAAAMVTVMRLFDVTSGEEVGMADLPNPNSVHSAAFSGDGALLAVGADELLQVWGTAPFERRHQFSARFGHPNTLAFTADAAWLGAGTRDGEAGLWNMATGEGGLRANAHDDSVRAVAFTPDGGTLATASFDRTAKLWEAPDLRPMRTLRGHTKSLFAVAVNPEGDRLLTGGFENRTKVWDLEDVVNGVAARSMAFAPGHGLAAGALEDGIGVWDVDSGHEVARLPEAHGRLVAFAGDGHSSAARKVAVAFAERGAEDPYRAVIWDMDSGAIDGRWSFERLPNKIALNATGDRLLALTGTSLSAYGVAAAAPVAQWDGVQAFALDTRGERLAIAQDGEDGTSTIRLIQVQDNGVLREETLQSAYGLQLAFAPGDSHLVVGGGAQRDDGNTGILWRIPVAGGEITTWEGHRSGVAAMAWSDDGSRLATGSHDSSILLWDEASGEVLQTFDGHASNIQSLALTSIGPRLASASMDGTFKIWDTRNGREIVTLRSVARGSGASAVNQPEQVRFSEDGRTLAAFVGPEPQGPYFYRTAPLDAVVAEEEGTP